MPFKQELIQIGIGFLDTGKYEKAIEYFTKSIETDPNYSEAYEYRGIAQYKILKIPEALTDLNKAVKINPQNHNAWFNKGEIHFFRKEFIEAEACYLKANETYTGSFFYLSGLAEVSLKLKKYQPALNYCNEILKDAPADAIALTFRISAYAGLKNYNNAIKDCLKLLDLDKKTSTRYNNLGFYYSKIGELRKAENNLNVALQLNPTHPYALDNLGYVYYLQDKLEPALNQINKSLEIDPSNSYGYKNRALVYLKQNKLTEAQEDLHKAKALGYSEEYDDEVENLIHTYF